MSPTPEARRRRKALGAVTAACVVFLILGGFWVGARILSITQDLRETQKINTRVLSLIEDCTIPQKPPTECAKRSAEQTARAVSLISQETQYRIVVALGCETEEQDTIEEIEACVNREMAKIEKRRP